MNQEVLIRKETAEAPNPPLESRYDVAIIGAGASGLSAAAHLIAAGKKVLILESLGHVGGRAASYQIDGFTLNEGAIAVEVGGALEETFAVLGLKPDIREPQKPYTAFRIEGKLVDVSKGGWGVLLGMFTKKAAQIGSKLADARGGDLPEDRLSTEEWLKSFTKNETVHAIFRNLCGTIWGANADELPARAFLTYFSVKGALKRFGFCPRGTGGIWQDMAAEIRRRGGTIALNSQVAGLISSGSRVSALDVQSGGKLQRVEAGVVLSSIGPAATASLPGAEAFGAAYIERAKTAPRPASMIVIYFATQKRLIDTASYLTFGKTRRLCNLVELTATCPELAPPGWFMYVAFSVPKPSLSSFDEAPEIEASLQDLRDEFPDGFNDQVKMLNIRVMRDGWPAQRSCAGFDLEQETPLENLWHVGDAVKDYGDGGMPACATTGRTGARLALDYLAGATASARP